MTVGQRDLYRWMYRSRYLMSGVILVDHCHHRWGHVLFVMFPGWMGVYPSLWHLVKWHYYLSTRHSGSSEGHSELS